METQLLACFILSKLAKESTIKYLQNNNNNNREVMKKVLRYMNSAVSQQRKMYIATKINFFLRQN